MSLQSGHAIGSPVSASANAGERREHQQRMVHSKPMGDITATLPDIVMCSLHALVAGTG